jgi:hypothetical protein
MRIVVFYVYLSLLLVIGGAALYVGTHQAHNSYSSAHNLPKKAHTKLSNSDQGNSWLEDADIDLDEDYLRGHDAEDHTKNSLLVNKYALSAKWYLSFAPALILHCQNKNFNTHTPLGGHSSPLYITQRVLRI